MSFTVTRAAPADALVIAAMVVVLTDEISVRVGDTSFNLNVHETSRRCGEMLVWGHYFVWLAWENDEPIGFIGLSESHALFAGGIMGTVQEFYVVPAARSKGVGAALLDAVKKFAAQRGMHRLEVCTPPVPVFDGNSTFYERHKFEVSGGQKMKFLPVEQGAVVPPVAHMVTSQRR